MWWTTMSCRWSMAQRVTLARAARFARHPTLCAPSDALRATRRFVAARARLGLAPWRRAWSRRRLVPQLGLYISIYSIQTLSLPLLTSLLTRALER
ncbi:uncharacterized protein TRAVEDRAFT_140588 [Trametes versicolor FP-101664 SS1]|uniref:uncharacterized protein n=1 Tax=Trametes versicolor (strain FP-101664) TaxID=717944 RepID=UPI0004623503|nr:uncharacterized protein TRAVEDRAFT_140588 [Trametes versicolor FP-101664 SS1]EIW65197.1 hypothetical protein TRAVEDRAFT_140588 [Trametes versicolor FP-101664 SS1]